MEALGFPLREEAVLHALTEDVLKSSEIEEEVLDREQARSYIARRLGMEIGGLVETDCDIEGVVEMMLDATQNYAQPLTAELILANVMRKVSFGIQWWASRSMTGSKRLSIVS